MLITMLATATPSSTPLPPTPTAPPEPTPTPVPPKPITVALVGEPESLHPLYATSTAAQTVAAALFVGCIGQDETGAPMALGCERVPTQENGDVRFAGEGDDRHLEVTFRIRPGWRWTDGTPVTAQDAVYAWQLVMSPEGQLRDPITQKVFSMTPADERTIVVQFMSAAQARAAAAGALRGDVPFEYFSQLGDYAGYQDQAGPVGDAFYWAVARWLPSHLLRDVPPSEQFAGVFSAKPVGDGAFELSAWNRGSDIALTRSSQPFPLESKGDAPGIVFKIVPDEDTAAQLVKDGGAQLSPPLPVEVVSRTFGTPSHGIALEQLTMPAFEQLVMNVSRPPFDDAKVRQAVRQALDVPAILLDPNAGPITTPFSLSPAGLFRGLPEGGFAAAYDPAQAKALLAEAGWLCGTTPCTKPVTQTDGTAITQTLEFTLVTNERVPRNALSQLIQKQLGAAGFGVNIEIVHGLGRNSKLFAPYEQGGILLTRDFDAALFQAPSLLTLSGAFDCASIPTEENHAPSQGNAAGYCDPDADALIAQAETGEGSASDAGRRETVSKAVSAIADAAPVVALYSPVWVLPSAEVGGLRSRGLGPATWNAWEWQQLSKP